MSTITKQWFVKKYSITILNLKCITNLLNHRLIRKKTVVPDMYHFTVNQTFVLRAWYMYNYIITIYLILYFRKKEKIDLDKPVKLPSIELSYRPVSKISRKHRVQSIDPVPENAASKNSSTAVHRPTDN